MVKLNFLVQEIFTILSFVIEETRMAANFKNKKLPFLFNYSILQNFYFLFSLELYICNTEYIYISTCF